MEDQRMAVDEQRPKDRGEDHNVGAVTISDLFDAMGRATFHQTLAGRHSFRVTKSDLNRPSGSPKN